MTDKLKHALLDMILDLDSHYPEDEMTDDDYEWFYKRYIEPIIIAKAYALHTEKM